MPERRDRQLVNRLLSDPVALTAYVLIGLQLIYRAVTISRSYYWQDDFRHLSLMREEGLTPSTLVRDYNDHLEILNNVLYWLLSRAPTTHFWPAVVVIMLLQVAASVLMWQLLRHLLVSRPSLLIPFAVFLFSPLMLVSTLWLAAALEMLWLQVAMLGALWCLFKWHDGGGRRWLVGTFVFHVVGLLAWEKSLVILPLMLASIVLIGMRGRPVRERLRTLRRHWGFWVGHLLVWVGYLALYLTVTDGSEKGLGSLGFSPFTAASRILFALFLPGMFGAPWTSTGADNTQYPYVNLAIRILAILAVLVLFALSVYVSGRNALEPWLLLLLYVAGDIALVLWGRAGFLELVARDPRYVADAVPVACICIALAFQGGRTDAAQREEEEEAPHASILSQPVAASLAVVLTASCLLTGIQLAPVVERTYSRDYVRTLLEEYDRYPGRAVVDTVTTPQIAFMNHSDLLEAVGQDAPFNKPSTRLFMFDSLATMRLVELKDLVVSHSGPKKDCGYPVGRKPVVIGELDEKYMRGDLVARVGYVTGVDARIRLRVGDHPWQQLRVTPGLGYAWFVIPQQSGEILVQAIGEEGVCISDIRVGQPWPAPSA